MGVKSSKKRFLEEKIIRDKNGNPANIMSVTLLDDFSPWKCAEWDTFFYHDSSLFVTGKCWGYFLVCYQGIHKEAATTQESTFSTPKPATATQQATTDHIVITTPKAATTTQKVTTTQQMATTTQKTTTLHKETTTIGKGTTTQKASSTTYKATTTKKVTPPTEQRSTTDISLTTTLS